jgi:hypothetical protein
MASIRSFLSGIIDYAGLFSPADLDMRSAVRNYAEYRASADRDLLGRFVVPSARLGEFTEAARGMLERGVGSVPWCLSVLVGDDLVEARRAMLEFTSRHTSTSDAGHALCDAVEMGALDEQQMIDAAIAFPRPLHQFFEISLEPGFERMLEVVGGHRASAKLRTGGVTPDAFPSSETIVRFVAGCNELGLPFKATAGLHHPLCGTYPLTYATDAPQGTMYGYVNLFLVSAFIRKGIGEREARAILEESSADAFSFRESGVSWRGNELNRDDLRMTRSRLFLSFGSCSFREPVDEARALGFA